MHDEKDTFRINTKKFTTAQQAILTTILYSDIFNFPLTREELWCFLITRRKIAKSDFDSGLNSAKNFIKEQDGYYCLKNRENIIARRTNNAPEVEKKMRQALFVAEKLSKISSIVFIGVSGGLAVENAGREDDIDLVIILKKNTLFVSRFLVLLVLESLGVRRTRGQKNTADTICVNLLFDETALGWFGTYKDIYTAREIAQIKPLFEKNNMYKKFLISNKWIQSFLPNSIVSKNNFQAHSNNNRNIFTILVFNPFFEMLARRLQIAIMKRHQTIEIVDKHFLAFHPVDYRFKTLRQLRLKMRQLGLLTKI